MILPLRVRTSAFLLIGPLVLPWVLPVRAAAAASEETAQERTPYLGLVTADRVRLRSGPGRSYEVLHTFHRGAKIRVTGVQGEWYAAELPEGVACYVHQDYLRPMEEGWAQVLGDRVQLRAAPRTSASALASLRSGDRLETLGRQGEWVRVRPPTSCRGWVHHSYVTVLERQGTAAGASGSATTRPGSAGAVGRYRT